MESETNTMHVKLVVASGKNAATQIDVKPGISLVGRGQQCHIRSKSPTVSRCHCAIIYAHGRLWLQDLESQHGTYVNDTLLPPDRKRRLSNGDRIRLGKANYRIQIDSVDDNAMADLLTDLDELDRNLRIDRIAFDNQQRQLEIATEADTVIDDSVCESTVFTEIAKPHSQSEAKEGSIVRDSSHTKSAAVAGLRQMLSSDSPVRGASASEPAQSFAAKPASTIDKWKRKQSKPIPSKSERVPSNKSRTSPSTAKKSPSPRTSSPAHSWCPEFLEDRQNINLLAIAIVLPVACWFVYSSLTHDPTASYILFID